MGSALRAFERVWTELIVRIKGDAWKLTDMAIEELRQKKYPDLLHRLGRVSGEPDNFAFAATRLSRSQNRSTETR